MSGNNVLTVIAIKHIAVIVLMFPSVRKITKKSISNSKVRLYYSAL